MPIISLNGTSDSVVPYEGGLTGYQAIPDVVDYWVNHNNIATEPTTNSVDSVERPLKERTMQVETMVFLLTTTKFLMEIMFGLI